jgi:hypothetical protein
MFLPNSDDLYRLIRVLYTEKYKYTTMKFEQTQDNYSHSIYKV